jgi:MFS family permease
MLSLRPLEAMRNAPKGNAMAEAVIGVGGVATPAAYITPAYRKYALALLVAIYTVNFLDRQIINTIGESIKTDLHLTDSQIGALGGIYFAALYTILGIPIAWGADKANRPTIMTASLALWSGFTVLSGLARNYAVLAIARTGVGIGEAGCSPTAHSLLADYFPKEKRATALAIYSMGISIGTLLGMAIGGIVAEKHGWRAAFFVAGAPGLVFAVLAQLTLREPRTQLSRDARAKAEARNHIPLLMVFSTLEKRPTFWLFAFGGAFASFVSYAQAQFLTPFFLRNHGPALAELAGHFGMAPAPGTPALGFVSLAMGLAAGIGGAFGSWTGGALADKWGAKDIRNYALFPVLIYILCIPVLWYVASSDNMMLALLLMVIPNIGVGAWWGSVYGGVQSLVPTTMRAMSAAVLLFVINIIGLGGGPTAFGAVTDLMTNHYLIGSGLDVGLCKTAAGAAKGACAIAAAQGIKTTVYLSTAVLPVAMLCFLVSRWTIGKDMEQAEVVETTPMSTLRLALYMALFTALPGAFLAHASGSTFLVGGVAGAVLGAVTAFVIAGASRRQIAGAH